MKTIHYFVAVSRKAGKPRLAYDTSEQRKAIAAFRDLRKRKKPARIYTHLVMDQHHVDAIISCNFHNPEAEALVG